MFNINVDDCFLFIRLPNGHINFEKFWQLAKQVTEFMTWKQVTCPFEKHPKVIHYLQTGTILSENGISWHCAINLVFVSVIIVIFYIDRRYCTIVV